MAEIHMGGLVSDLDTQSIIDKLLEIRRIPIQTLSTKKEGIEADIAAWSDINTYMSDLTSSLDTLRSWDVWNKMSASSSDSTKLTATASTAANPGVYSINITQLAQAHSVASDRASDLSPGATANSDLVALGVLTQGDQFTIAGQTITIGATESLNSLKGKINAASSSMPAADRVTAVIVDDRLVITRNNTGDTDISMADVLNTPLQDLGVLLAPGVWKNELVTSEDAAFTVNGISVTRSSNTGLTDVIEGVTLDLLDVTPSAVTLTIARDTSAAKDAILDFIDKYNVAAAKLTEYGKIDLIGDKNPDGALLDAVGELAEDSLVRTILTNMRKEATGSKYPALNPINASYTYNGQTGVCDSLEDVGVWTQSKENTLAVTDETKLDYMLANYFDTVEQLFRGIYDPTVGYQNGVASDFYRYAYNVSTSMTGEIDRRITRLNEQINDIDEDILKLELSVETYETFLWKQFGAMEDAIANMQSELSWLSAQLGIK